MNSAQLVGRISTEPQLRYTQNGKAVCNFNLAVRDPFSKEGDADFIPCVAWEKAGELIAEGHNIGDFVALEGRIKPRSWEDDDGVTHYVTEVVVTQLTLIPTKAYYLSQAEDKKPKTNKSKSNTGNGKKQNGQRPHQNF